MDCSLERTWVQVLNVTQKKLTMSIRHLTFNQLFNGPFPAPFSFFPNNVLNKTVDHSVGFELVSS